MERILIIDDDVDMCLLLEKLLVRKGYQVVQLHCGYAALDFLEHTLPDLVICDLRLGDTDGITVLKKVKEKSPTVPFIIITAYDDIQMSLNAVKCGAFEYVTKPILPEEILLIVHNALNKNKSSAGFSTAGNFSTDVKHFFGNSEYFKNVNNQINLVAPTDYNVVLYGETGSGKKVLAYEIHKRSRRSKMPFIAVTSDDLSRSAAGEKDDLLPDERMDFFEAANGGTVLLHNITALSQEMQDALFRAIRNKRMKRSGTGEEIDFDVRVMISSTDYLWNAMLTGAVNEDLFSTLNDFSIELLPLRSRKDDIVVFANYFLRQATKEMEKQVAGFAPGVENIFKNYTWPGNLRELKNVINKAILLTHGDLVAVESLPPELRKQDRFFEVAGY